MNQNPNLGYNIIKGLQIFINDIRSCTTKEAENKRVEKELNKIREKFAAGKALTGYEKKKCVWKLLYVYILGFKVDFGHNYMADLITSLKFSEKMTGYIAMSVLFKEDNQEINIMINSIRNDILQNNSLSQSMALSLATNLNNKDLLIAVAQDVIKYMTNFGEKELYTVKKALVCLSKVIRIKKEVHDASSWSKYINKMIELRNFEILLSCASLILNIFQINGTTGYEELANKFFNNVLYKMKECPDEYVYYHIKCPWLQIKILKILQFINPSSLEQITLTHLKEYIDYIAKKTYTIVASETKYTRFYAEYCIFFEVVNVLDHFNLQLNHKTFDTFLNILGCFLHDDSRKHPNKDVNTRYLALDSMAKLSKYTSGSNILNEHSAVIISSLRDNDVSIRRRSLDLLFLCCTNDSVVMICKELLLYFKEDEPQLKEDVALKIAILAEKYATDYTWYIDVCLKMLEVAGDYVNEDIIYRIVQIVVGFENQEPNTALQMYSCEKIVKLLEKDYIFENLVKIAALLLGEFGYMLEESNCTSIKTLSSQVDLLLKHLPTCSNNTTYAIFNCFMKFININSNIRFQAVPVFEQYLDSWDTELQQRAIEYMILAKLDGEDSNIPNVSEIRAKLFEKMPAFNQEIFGNSILMKRLKQTGLTINTSQSLSSTASNVESQNLDNISKTSINPVIDGSRVSMANFLDTNVDNLGVLMTSNSSDQNPYSNHTLYMKDPGGFAKFMNKNPQNAVLIRREQLGNNADLFKSLVSNPSNNGGLIYSDQNVKVDCKIKFFQSNNSDATGILGIMFNFIPISESKLEEIEFQLTNYHTTELLNIQISKVKYPDYSNSLYPQVLMKAQLFESFSTFPTCYFNAKIGMMKISTSFTLPLVITKYLEPLDLKIEDFTAMWFEYSNSSDEKFQKLDAIMTNPMSSNSNNTIMDFLKKFGGLMTNLQFKVYPPCDRDNFHDLEGVAVLNYEDKSHSIPVLFQASFVPSLIQEFRFSLRSKNMELDRFSSLLLDIYSVVKFYINPV